MNTRRRELLSRMAKQRVLCGAAKLTQEELAKELEQCQRKGITLTFAEENNFPANLKHIYDPPPLLMMQGDDILALNNPCIAIVGSRKASEWGRNVAFELARDLAKRGVTVVSGMAYGIDAAAHKGALAAGGKTVAVWGTGLECIYPTAHRELAKRIQASGALISEFPLYSRATRWSFPQRNRIISGLSLGVVVVEAAMKSGSLITMRFALEQGREVFAVPGFAGHVQSQGSNQLLRDGAHFAENAEDILAQVGLLDSSLEARG